MVCSFPFVCFFLFVDELCFLFFCFLVGEFKMPYF